MHWRFPNAATPIGSRAYYVVRLAPASRRDDLALLFLWHQHVWAIANGCRDTGVARLKLDWWRSEIHAATRLQSSHPLAQALGPCMQRHGVSEHSFAPLLDAVERDILHRPFADLEHLNAHCSADMGTFSSVLALICGQSHGDAQATARAAGSCIGLIDRLQYLGRDLRRARCYLPEDICGRYGLRASDTESLFDHHRCRPVFADYAAAVQRRLQALPTPDMPRPLGLMLRIATVVLQEIQAGDYPVLQSRLELSALRMLWLAWRTPGTRCALSNATQRSGE